MLLSYSSKSNWYAHTSSTDTDPHENFMHKVEIKPNFHYYDIPDFRKTQQIWDRRNSLSIFHTNVSSLQANFGKLEDLITDLAWNFDVIALSEAWNDEKKTTLLHLFSKGIIPTLVQQVARKMVVLVTISKIH